MAKIQIKRGLQSNINSLVLSEGELAAALDTGNLYLGTTTGKIHVNPPGGEADVAVKLKTPRNFSVSGDATAPNIAFDGSDNVQLVLTLKAMGGLSAGTYTKLTVNTKGQVIAAEALSVDDIPNIPNSKVTGLGTAATKNVGTASGNIVSVEADGKINVNLIPSIALMDIFEAASQSAMLAVSAQKGDICVRTDENKSYILASEPATTAANWKWLRTPDSAVVSVNGKTGAVTLNAGDVGAAATSHTHAIANITSLQTVLDEKEALIKNAAAKTTLVDADTLPLSDSAASSGTKKITFANIKTVLKTYFDTLYNNYVHPTTSGNKHIPSGGATRNILKWSADGTAVWSVEQTYTLPAANGATLGGIKTGGSISVANGIVTVEAVDGGTF